MSAATIIKSTDANVPVLSGTEGGLAALIRYIAPILGWEIMFDNGPVIVVRPQSYKGGQPLLYRFDDRAARGGSAPKTAEVRAYESMSDIDTGAGLVGPAYVHKSYTSDITARKYYVIGDQFGFVLGSSAVNQYLVNYATCQSYFGFLNAAIESDTPICVLLAHMDGSLSNLFLASSPQTIGSVNGCFIHKNRGGAINICVAQHNPGGFQEVGWGLGGNSTTINGSVGAAPSYPYYGDCILSRPYINDGARFTIRGYIPGLWAFHHGNISTVFENSEMQHVPSNVVPVNIGNKQLVRCYAHTSSIGNIIYDAVGSVYDIGEGYRE